MFPNSNPLAPAGQALSQAWRSTKNAFGQLSNTLSQTPEAQWFQQQQYQGGPLYVPPGAGAGMNRTKIPGYSYDPYQIGAGDTFAAIAAKNNLTVEELQAANNGMLVPPPKGSYINLPAQQPVSIGYLPNAQAMEWLAARQSQGPVNADPFLGDNRRDSNLNLNQLVPELMQQLKANILPPIPAAAQARLINPDTGRPITGQELQDMGYVFDQGSRNWVNSTPGSAAGQGGGAAGTVTTPAGTGSAEFMNTGFMRNYAKFGTDFMNQRRWDGKKFVKIGDLIRQGRLDPRTGRMYDQRMKRNKHGKLVPKNKGQQPAPVEPTLGAGATPSNQLNTNQGGG